MVIVIALQPITAAIEASGTDALPYMTTAIKGKDGAAQFAALQMVPNVHALPSATATLAALLPAVEPPVQIALIGEARTLAK